MLNQTFILLNNLKVFSSSKLNRLLKSRKGDWLQGLGWMAAACVALAFVLLPAFRTFCSTVVTSLNTWWTSISTHIFQTS